MKEQHTRNKQENSSQNLKKDAKIIVIAFILYICSLSGLAVIIYNQPYKYLHWIAFVLTIMNITAMSIMMNNKINRNKR